MRAMKTCMLARHTESNTVRTLFVNLLHRTVFIVATRLRASLPFPKADFLGLCQGRAAV